MKGIKRIIIWTVGAIVALLIIIAAGVAIFFPKEKAKEMAIDKISSALERKVTVESVSISFWGGLGIYLEGIRIANPQRFEGPDFLSATALDVKLRLFPLLRKEVQIDRLILVKPQIALHKLKDGRHNYKFGTTQMPGAPAIPPSAKDSSQEEISDETKVAALAISFDNLSIEKGTFRYLDDSAGMQIFARGFTLNSRVNTPAEMVFHTIGTLDIDSLKITLTKSKIPPLIVSARYDATIDLKGNNIVLANSKLKVNELEFDVKAGIPNLTTMAFVNLEMATERVDIDDIISILPDTTKSTIAPYSIEGKVGFNVNIKYNKSSKLPLNYSGKASFSDLKLSKKDIIGELIINSANADFKNDYFRIAIEKGSFDNNPLEGILAVSNFKSPEIDGRFKGKINLASLNPFLPKKGNPKISGLMQFDIGASGSIKVLSTMQISGSLAIKDGSYSASTLPEPIEKFDFDMRMTPRSMDINNLNVKLPSSDFALSGKMTDPLPGLIPGYKGDAPRPNLTFKMSSHRFDTDKLFPEAVPGSGVNRAGMTQDSLPLLIIPDINGFGSASLDTLIYAKVEFTQITTNMAIKDRKIFITQANGNVYTGKVKGETEIDLNDFSNPKYTGKYEATQVQADDFLTRFTDFGGHIFGKLNMNGSFSASGWEPEPFVRSLSMDGLAVINEAKLVNFEPLKQLAQNLNFKTFDEETLKDAATAFKVVNGRVAFDGMKFISSIGNWNVTGSIGFDGTLDYLGEVLLSDDVTGQLMSQSGLVSGLAGLFKESSSGRVRVPFRLAGSYASPKISIDMSAKNQLKDNLKGQFDSALQNLLQKK